MTMETTQKRIVSESFIREKLKNGRKIQKVGDTVNSKWDRLVQIIVAQLNVDYDDVSIFSTFTGHLGADSLDLVEMILAVEEEFNIEIPDKVAEKFKTVGDVYRYISEGG